MATRADADLRQHDSRQREVNEKKADVRNEQSKAADPEAVQIVRRVG